ncbi:MAG: hypothetical protein SOY45_02755 [Lachnospiraceae bacterium]|nr:hypothetical protein [Lachnospiraceae bacterium]MDY4068788.1 hypothetical protein [Lachnospiraceae bacterium]
MRKYEKQERQQLTEVICNCCGRNLKVRAGIVEEECVRIEAAFGFFSQKDGEIHRFDLCEACYDRIVAGFRVPVEKEDKTELL